MLQFQWTEARVKQLELFWSETKTAKEIGALIGCSKNAVIGKASRLGLPSRNPEVFRNPPPPKAIKVKIIRVCKPKPVPITRPVSLGLGYPMDKLTKGMCICPVDLTVPKAKEFNPVNVWKSGEVRNWHKNHERHLFCGAPTDGHHYCAECQKKCYSEYKPFDKRIPEEKEIEE